MSSHVVRPCCLSLPSPRLLSSTSRPFVRPLPGLTVQRAATSRLCPVVSRCAADVTSEPSPEDPATAAIYRKYREEMDKYERAYTTTLRQEAMVAELQITLFRDEDDKLQTYMREIASNRCILYKEEARGLALTLCLRVGMVIRLSASIAANARLRVDDASSGISFLTVEQMIRTYISTFLKIVEDTCHGKVDRKSIIKFLDALSGLAAISHILIKDALDVVNNIEDCSKSFSMVYDIDALNHELQCNMKELEMNFTSASDTEAYELLLSTLTNATNHVSLFVIQMTNLRKEVVTHIRNNIQGPHM